MLKDGIHCKPLRISRNGPYRLERLVVINLSRLDECRWSINNWYNKVNESIKNNLIWTILELISAIYGPIWNIFRAKIYRFILIHFLYCIDLFIDHLHLSYRLYRGSINKFIMPVQNHMGHLSTSTEVCSRLHTLTFLFYFSSGFHVQCFPWFWVGPFKRNWAGKLLCHSHWWRHTWPEMPQTGSQSVLEILETCVQVEWSTIVEKDSVSCLVLT